MKSLEMKEFRVNKYITLKLENNETNIYIDGNFFNQCKFLLITIPVKRIEALDEIKSIDDAVEALNTSLETQNILDIPSETIFWGHCSNLQVWFENDYNTNLLHSNLSFPLLKKLTELGDPIAKKVFKEEIAKRIEQGNFFVLKYLIEEHYIDSLSREEFLYSLLREQDAEIINSFEKFIGYYLTPTSRIDDDHDNIFIYEDKKVVGIHISNSTLKEFFKPLTQLKDLYILGLENSLISELSDLIGNLQDLNYLYLNNNKLKNLPNSIDNCYKLRELHLGRNKLKSIPESIKNLKDLEVLIMNENKITFIPEFIGDFEWLRTLNLKWNKITTLPECIGHLKRLDTLNLEGNNITMLPESIGSLENLRLFNLRGNKLTSIPESIGKLENLEKLDLRDNELKTLPKSIMEESDKIKVLL